MPHKRKDMVDMGFKKFFSAILALGLSMGSIHAFAETSVVTETSTAMETRIVAETDAAAEATAAITNEEHTLPTLPENALENYYERKSGLHTFFYSANNSSYEQDIFWGLSADQKKELESAVREITGMVDSSWSDLKKALFINDYMALTCEYDLTYSKYTAYDNIVGHTSVCQGYAEAYWLLMNRLGVDCKIVTSWDLNHAWNLVKVGGKWYHVDVTWNDPLPNREGRSRHEYFLLSDEEMYNSGHNTTDWCLSYEGSASAVGLAVDKTYDCYSWRNYNSGIAISANGFYFVDKKSYSLNHLSESGNIKEIVDLSGYRWYVKGEVGSYWVGAYSGCGIFNDRVYFNTPKEIKSCSLNGDDIRTEYTLSAEEASVGDLYGLYILDTVLYYTVTEGPNRYENDISIQKSIDLFIKDSVLFGIITSSDLKNSSVKVQLSGGGKSFFPDIMNGKYSFKNIPDGIYVLNISKLGHCPKAITVSVSNSAPMQLNDELHLYGDINGDGKVNIVDVARANAHAKNTKKLEGYDFSVCDVSGDGNVNIVDVARMNAHVKNTKNLW